MALVIRNIPVLTGTTAAQFVRKAEENENKGKLVQFSEDYVLSAEKMMERSKKFMKKLHGRVSFE